MSILVEIVHMSPDDAWNCTVREFWRFYEAHLAVLGIELRKDAPKFDTAEAVFEFEEHLRSIGAL